MARRQDLAPIAARWYYFDDVTQVDIGRRLGLSRAYVSSLIKDPTGSKERDRHKRYGGACEICGNPTDGSRGARLAPKRCHVCTAELLRKNKYWTDERILEAAREWARRTGRAPTIAEWSHTQVAPDGYRFPNFSICFTPPGSKAPRTDRPWPSWNSFLSAAGLPVRLWGGWQERRDKKNVA